MATRLELHGMLCNIPGVGQHAYFQSPENHKMVYPCIRYERDKETGQHADNIIYIRNDRYVLTVMDYDPDSKIAAQVGELFQIKMEQHYVSNNLHHFVYKLNW